MQLTLQRGHLNITLNPVLQQYFLYAPLIFYGNVQTYIITYRDVLVHTSAPYDKWCTTTCEVNTNFAAESVSLMAHNIWDDVITLHKSPILQKMLYPYMQTFLMLVKEVLLSSLKLF